MHRADRRDANPKILRFERAVQRKFERLGIPVYVVWCWRNEKEQNAAFESGASNAKYGHSPHNFGCAVDIVHATKFWDVPDEFWIMLHEIASEVASSQNISLVYGFDWGWDKAHFELTEWRTTEGVVR